MAYADRERDAGRPAYGFTWIWWVLGAVALFLIVWAIIIAARERPVGSGGAATIGNITDNPSAYYGRAVTVSGEVNQTVGPRAFTIGGEGFGGAEVLVVGAQDLPQLTEGADQPIRANDIVQVTGTVRPFDIGEFEGEAGADLQDDLFADWAGRPAIMAQQIVLTPRTGSPAAVGNTPAGG